MSTTTQPVDLDAEVSEYVALTEKIEELTTQRAGILARLRDNLTPGKHDTTFGVAVSVALPSRSFNTDRAWSMLTPAQQKLCTSPDPKKIKAQLPPVLAEQCMDEGTGAPRVTIR
jgi:hypothetical protein